MAYRKMTKEEKKEWAIKKQEKNEKWLDDFMMKFMQEKHIVPWDNGMLNKIEKRGGGCGISGPYHNGNAWLTYCYLTVFGWDTKQFRTYDQIKKLGGDLKEGVDRENDFVLIEYPVFKWYDKDGNPAPKKYYKDEDGKKLGFVKKWVGNALWQVYNLAQTTLDYEPDFTEIENEEPMELGKAEKKAERILKKYYSRKDAPKLILLDYTDTACYQPLTDTVKISNKKLFKSQAHYYSTAFHETVHSTGAKTRLDTFTAMGKGTKGYAIEELRAEIGATKEMVRCGFKREDYLENNALYVQYWIQRATEIEHFGKVLLSASSKADKAIAMIEGEDR